MLQITISYPESRRLVRIPHDIERRDVDNNVSGGLDFMGPGYRFGPVRDDVFQYGLALPEVYRFRPDHVVPLYDDCMWLWRRLNPEFSDDKFCAWLGNALFMTNKTGFPGRRNIILRKDLDKKFPSFDAARMTGGATMEVTRIEGSKVFLKSMIVGRPLPTVEQVRNDQTLWFWGTSVNRRGEVNIMTKLGIDGNRHGCRVPFFTAREIWLPASELHFVDTINDPRWMA